MPHTSKRRAAMTSPLWLGLVLLATSAAATEPKTQVPWAELVPVPAKLPATKPQPSERAPCQPENFIPGETGYKKDAKGKGSYKVEEGVELAIHGPTKLPGGYELTQYEFSCASASSSVLDITKNGKRHALYQHVYAHDAHPAKPILYFAQAERKQGRYQNFTGLVYLEGKRKIALPAIGCTHGDHASLKGDRLLTYGAAYGAKNNRTDVCVWSLDGKLQSRLHADISWMAAADYALTGSLGLLPNQPEVFYSINRNLDGDMSCELRLQSVKRAELFRRIPLGEECQTDLTKVTLQ
jgi:hypothetical protein